MKRLTPAGAVVRGLVAATAGTAVMDLQQYIGYRMGAGTTGFLQWEFGGIENWQQASTPGQVGKRIVEAWTEKPLAPRWADLTNSIVHWSFGIQWGTLFGIVAGSTDVSPVVLGPPYGVFVWLFGYMVLPLGHFYKPIWEYDPKTLGKDLFSHLVYGTATGIAYRLLSTAGRHD
jgi:hypothetical protein